MAAGPHVITCTESISVIGCGLPADTVSIRPVPCDQQHLSEWLRVAGGSPWGVIRDMSCFLAVPWASFSSLCRKRLQGPNAMSSHHRALVAPGFTWRVSPGLKWPCPLSFPICCLEGEQVFHLVVVFFPMKEGGNPKRSSSKP